MMNAEFGSRSSVRGFVTILSLVLPALAFALLPRPAVAQSVTTDTGYLMAYKLHP
jgi:hypothetical protein